MGHNGHAFPEACQPVLQDLLERAWKTKGYPQVHVSFPAPRRLAITVVARDWPGLLDIVTTYLHTLGINLSLIVASLLRQEGGLSLSGIYIEAPLPGDAPMEDLETTLTQELPTIIESGEELREILLIGTRKLKVYQRIIRVFQKQLSEEEFQALIRSREIVYFVHARSEAYLMERDPQTLAHIIWTNWTFQEAIRREGRGIHIDIRNLTTRREDREETLTGITVVGLDAEISLDAVMDALREYDPSFRRKYDKEFVTPDGIAVIRLEIADAQERAYPPSLHPAIRRHLYTRLRTGRRRWSAPPGAEVLGRVIIPRLVMEALQTGVPQMLLLPQLVEEDAVRYTLVVSLREEDFRRHTTPLLTALVERLNQIPGVHVTGYRPPSQMQQDGEAAVYLLVDLSVTGSTEEHEALYQNVQKILRDLLHDVRDFDMGMRQQDSRKLDQVLTILADREVNPQFARKFYYAMNAFQRLMLSAELIVEEILLAEDLLREHFQKDTPVVRERQVGAYYLVGVAAEKDVLPLQTLTRLVEDHHLHMTSFVAYGSSVAVLGGRVQDPEALREQIQTIAQDLQMGEPTRRL